MSKTPEDKKPNLANLDGVVHITTSSFNDIDGDAARYWHKGSEDPAIATPDDAVRISQQRDIIEEEGVDLDALARMIGAERAKDQVRFKPLDQITLEDADIVLPYFEGEVRRRFQVCARQIEGIDRSITAEEEMMEFLAGLGESDGDVGPGNIAKVDQHFAKLRDKVEDRKHQKTLFEQHPNNPLRLRDKFERTCKDDDTYTSSVERLRARVAYCRDMLITIDQEGKIWQEARLS